MSEAPNFIQPEIPGAIDFIKPAPNTTFEIHRELDTGNVLISKVVTNTSTFTQTQIDQALEWFRNQPPVKDLTQEQLEELVQIGIILGRI